MSTLKARLEAQRTAVKEFESALEDLVNPPKYAPPTESEPLKLLKQQMQQAQDESDRALQLTKAQDALQRGKAALAELEREWIDAEAESDAVLQEMHDLAAQINLLSDALLDKAGKMLELYQQKLPAIQRVHGDNRQFLMNQRMLASSQIPVTQIHPNGLVEVISGFERDRRKAESAYKSRLAAQMEASEVV